MPLETPTVPSTNERTHNVTEHADRIFNDAYSNRAFFERAERQIAPQQSAEKWDLHEAPKAFDPDSVAPEAEPYVAAPEYAVQPKTRAQEIEESLFYLDDKQMLQYALDISKALRAMSRLA